MENHEDWPLPSPLSFFLITKNFTLRFHFCFVWYFISYIYFFSQINPFYFKIKYFYKKKIILKIYFKNSLESSGSKFPFFIIIKKIICNHILFGLASFSVFNKNFGFEQRHESKLAVPHKWDNSELNSCISIGELVKPLHKKNLFQNLFLLPHLTLVEIMSIYFFRSYIQDVCDN